MYRYWVQVMVVRADGSTAFANLDYQRMKLVPINKRPMPMGCFIKDSFLSDAIAMVTERTGREPLVTKLRKAQLAKILDMGQFVNMLHEEGKT